MPRLIKEYDLAAYQRKFAETYSMFEDGEVRYVSGVNEQEEGLTARCMTHTGRLSYVPAKMVYHHFKAGYYMDTEHFICVVRRNAKVFHVGFSPDGFKVFRFNDTGWIPYNKMWFLKTPPIETFDVGEALLAYGPISKRLFLGLDRVYYLNSCIGYREGSNFNLTHEAFTQEIKDALRGYECQITSM